MLTQCWSNVGPASATLAQHETSTGSTPCVCWAEFNPVNTKHLYNIGTMLDQHRRCWSDVVQMCWLGIAAGLVLLTAGGDYKPTPTQCLLNVGPVSPVLASIHSVLVSTSCWRYRHDALNQSWVNVGLPSVTLAHIQRGAKQDTNPILG